jgi:uncharacterized protein YukE
VTELPWVVLGVVGVLWMFYVARCSILVRSKDVQRRLKELQTRFEREIQTRAARGQYPDWLYYTDEAAREQEAVRESLRTYGTIALATGVGGTMCALVLYLLGDTTTAQDPVQQLLREMGWALTASLLGVVGNVLILWGLLPWANRRFDRQLDKYIEELQRTDEEISTDGSVAEAIGTQIGKELQGAITRIPESFERLEKAASELSEAVGGFESSVTTMTAVAGELSMSVGDLSGVPKELESVLEQARSGWSGEVDRVVETVKAWEAERLEAEDAWRAKLKAEIAKVGDQQNEVGHRLINATGDVVAAVTNLPSGVADSVDKIADSLGRHFGNEARQHVADLRVQLKETAEELQRGVEQSATNLQHQMSDLMRETLKRLGEISRDLTEVLEGFPGHVGKAKRTLTETEDKFRDVADLLAKSAYGLIGEHESTRDTLSKVEEAVRAHLEAVEKLTKALKRRAARPGLAGVVRGWFGRSDSDTLEGM